MAKITCPLCGKKAFDHDEFCTICNSPIKVNPAPVITSQQTPVTAQRQPAHPQTPVAARQPAPQQAPVAARQPAHPQAPVAARQPAHPQAPVAARQPAPQQAPVAARQPAHPQAQGVAQRVPVAAQQQTVPTYAANNQPAPKRKSKKWIFIPIVLAVLLIGIIGNFLGNLDTPDNPEVVISAEEILYGTWNREFDSEGISVTQSFIFYEDGTVESCLMSESYDYIIDQWVAMAMADITAEDLAADGFSSYEEAEEYLREYLPAEYPYEDIADDFEMTGTWELDGDTLTLTTDYGYVSTAETKLSEGKKTITLINEDGEEFVLKKAE